MGLIQSVLCSITFCTERVVAWLCCAFLLVLLMFILIMVTVYGISVGYHYAQKELATIAMLSRPSTAAPVGRRSDPETRPLVRLVAVNRTELENSPQRPVLEVYKDTKPRQKVFVDTTLAPIIVLETDRPHKQMLGLSPHERELAKKLIGRIRRSKNTTDVPFLRSLLPDNGTDSLQFAVT